MANVSPFWILTVLVLPVLPPLLEAALILWKDWRERKTVKTLQVNSFISYRTCCFPSESKQQIRAPRNLRKADSCSTLDQ